MKKLIISISITAALIAAIACCAVGCKNAGQDDNIPVVTEAPSENVTETISAETTIAATEKVTSEETAESSTDSESKETSVSPDEESSVTQEPETEPEIIETESEYIDDSDGDGGSNQDYDDHDNSDGALYYTGKLIEVNLSWNCVTIYDYGTDGSKEPIKAMRCSTAREGYETPVGTFYLGEWFEWCYMVDSSYGQFASRVTFDGYSHDGIMFHSVCYTAIDDSQLEYDEYNKLGDYASLGCIRLCVADAMWICYNCEFGTEIHIFYDESSPGPLGKPDGYWVPTHIVELRGWDPTDPASDNAWASYYIDISEEKFSIAAGSSEEDLLDAIDISDCYGNVQDVKYYAELSGNYDLNTPGTYTAHVYIDLSYYTKEADVTFEVVA